MRLWSIHPRYLDRQGLLALWREGLLARKVLMGQTRGYCNHPQLTRFRLQNDPLAAINRYLHVVCDEGARRGYRFDIAKLDADMPCNPIPVTHGQLRYEWSHLQGKLKQRDPERYRRLHDLTKPGPHPLFRVVPGDVEPWERPR